jgi:predicted TIM-barrel fold metal-dependent hydrolase
MNLDVHVHLDLGTDLARVARDAAKLKCRLALSALGLPFHMPGNEAVAEAIQRHPDVFIGLGYVALGSDSPRKVSQLHRLGFRGLKMICPRKDYDDKSYYPIYAKAEELRMPILFHTGVVARMDVWSRERGWTETAAVDYRGLDISSKRMRPICLDAIARAFPDLNLIMAHLGSFGRRDEAAAVLLHNPNVYADLTWFSGETRKAQQREKARLLMGLVYPTHYHKLLFGTDLFTSGGLERLKRGLKAIGMLLDEIKAPPDTRAQIMGKTAARLFGLE